MLPEYRRGCPADLSAVEEIQRQAPQAAHWDPRDYLSHELWVAADGGAIAGFLVLRRLAPDECELLNLAVAPASRRKRIASGLFRAAVTNFRGNVFLEVRASNQEALTFYKYLGFQEFSIRRDYYSSPPESAIVMKFHSC
ncbi:MAG: GNAT family N-acetyltransferase [Acidobacteria bacterium]|nr:GNAT family N-acetyltransferase [Acidobacteriota bacterium]